MRRWLPTAAVGIVAVLLAVACSAAGDKAGGAGASITLSMGNTGSGLGYSPEVEYFMTRVEELSGGRLDIELVNEFGSFEADAESQLIQGVADGTVDLGFAGTQALTSLGVHDFEALDAPMLIDSYALEDAVVSSDIPAGLLGGLDAVGVTGLGLLAGPMHKAIGVDEPLVAPSNFEGIGFGMYPSSVQETAIQALGATPMEVFGPARAQALANGDIQGFELTLLGYSLNALAPRAPYIAANVNLWPGFTVLVADPQRLEELTEDQRSWLQEAADESASRSTNLSNHEADLLGTICDSGARMALATGGDLAAFRDVFATVYASLEQDQGTKALIEGIQELGATTTPEAPLAIPDGCTGDAPVQVDTGGGGDTSILDGTYRWTLTWQDVLDAQMQDVPEFYPEGFPGTFTMELSSGTWSLSYVAGEGERVDEDAGPFSIEGDTIAFDWPRVGIVLHFSFSVDGRGNIHLTPILPMQAGDQFVWADAGWMKIA